MRRDSRHGGISPCIICTMAWPKGKQRSAETRAKLAASFAVRNGTLLEAFWHRVDRRGPDECWPWTGHVRPDGYGLLIYRNEHGLAHRASWFIANAAVTPTQVGDLVSPLDVDHICHNGDPDCPGGVCDHRRCVNPTHLRLTTRRRNVLSGKGHCAKNAQQGACANGHPYTVESTYHRPGTPWYRDCRRCKADRQRAYVARRKARLAEEA